MVARIPMIPVRRVSLIGVCVLALLFLPPGAPSAGEGKPGKDVSLSLFREIVRENARVSSIDAEMVQYISTPEHSQEVFRGRYRADRKGRFRIDFAAPERQVVVNDGERLYWYYPDSKLLYQFGSGEAPAGNPRISPLGEFAEDMEKNFQVRYLGMHLYGFFSTAHQFVLEDGSRGLTIDIWVDAGRNLLLSKRVRDAKGLEIMKEVYEDYRPVGGIFFPFKVDVSVRTAKGVTRNVTVYSGVRLNSGLGGNPFRLSVPRDVMRKYFHDTKN